MQNVFTLEINKYKIKLENFEGPLDLLCHLIDENKMDIYWYINKWNNRPIYRIYQYGRTNELRSN